MIKRKYFTHAIMHKVGGDPRGFDCRLTTSKSLTWSRILHGL